MLDFYKILELDFNCAADDVKRKFRQLATIYHPDKNSGSKYHEEKFKDILAAYETLYNKQKRERYDKDYVQYFNVEYEQSKYRPDFDFNKRNESSDSFKNPSIILLFEQVLRSYLFWILFVIACVLFFNSKSSENESEPSSRPQTGEINFK